jgi:hypothetical protein
MTTVTVSDGNLVVDVKGWDKLWSLTSQLVIPVNHVIRVYADATIAQSWWKGVRLGGTQVPGVITAGTFYHHGEWVFWDVHHPERALVIELRDEGYKKLIIEVPDPADAVARIQPMLPNA